MFVTPSLLGSVGAAGIDQAVGEVAAPATGAFAGALSSAIDRVNQLQSTAEQQVSGLLSGNGQDLHAAALSVERASLGFDLMLQVRNKVVGAYQEISKLQF
jgi:flagellar hook-basal body complex protein FliE